MKITTRPFQKNPNRIEVDIQIAALKIRKRLIAPLDIHEALNPRDAEKACIRWGKEKAAELMQEMALKPKEDKSKEKELTLRAFWPRFLEDYLSTKSPSTRTTYESHWRLHINPVIGTKNLSAITELILDKLKVSLSEKPCSKTGAVQSKPGKYKPVKQHAKANRILAPDTINAIIGTVVSMLERAFRWQLIVRVPEPDLLNVPNSEDSKIERSKYYDRKEADAICKAAYGLGLSFYVFVLLGCDGALRVSELCALRWENIDFGNKEISVNEAVITVKGGEIVKLPKMNKKGMVPMSERLFVALQTLYNASSEKQGRVLLRQELSEKSTRGIHKEGGVSPAVLKYWMKGITTLAAEIDPRIKPNRNPHKMRHTAGTRVAAETGNVMAVKQLLRHGSLSSSLIYMHSEYDSPIREALDASGTDLLSKGLRIVKPSKKASEG